MKSKYSIYLVFVVFFLMIVILPTMRIEFKSSLEKTIENQPEWTPELYEAANLFLKSQVFQSHGSSLPQFGPKDQIPTVVIARYRSENSTYPKTLLSHQDTPTKTLEDLSQKLAQEHRKDRLTGLKIYYPYRGLYPGHTMGDDLENHPDGGLFGVVGKSDTLLTPSEVLFGSHVIPRSPHPESDTKGKFFSNSHWSYFYVRSFMLTPQEIVPLFREHTMPAELTPQMLLTSAQRAGDALLADLGENGKFVYRRFSSVSADTSYNILRHAGTLWTLADLHQELSQIAKTPQTKYRDGWTRGVQYLLDHIKPCPTKQNISCVIEDDEIKVGGAALAILALTGIETVATKDSQDQSPSAEASDSSEITHRRAAESLGEWLLSELKEDGTFQAHKYLATNYEPTDFISEYYPGEAAFALMKLYKLSQNSKWLDAARSIIKAQILSQRSLPLDEVPHDHWLLYALAESQKVSPLQEEIDHVVFLSELIRKGQNNDPNGPLDWKGGYDEFPRSTPTAVRSEGLAAVHPLLFKIANTETVQANWLAIQQGINFQLQNQLGPEIIMELADSFESLGAFRKDLYSLETRIDYSQHNISSLLAFRRLLLEKNAH